MIDREFTWREIIKFLHTVDNKNARAMIVQTAISEFGPVPDSLAAAVRNAIDRPNPI